MKENKIIHNDLPTMLNAGAVANVFGISKAKVYELMNSDEFPTLRIGKRMMVSKKHFIKWIERKSGEPIE